VCTAELRLHASVNRPVWTRRAAFADGLLMMITPEPSLEDCVRHAVRSNSGTPALQSTNATRETVGRFPVRLGEPARE
jgi:hypothetical protein